MAAFASTASAQATRTWVSGVGDDVNPCSRTAPCKTWAGAISKTADGGEIDALDPGGYGAVTITKAITLNGNGYGSTLVAGTNGIIVNPGADDDVILRNMNIVGTGQVGACPWTGLSGVQILGGRTVRVDNVEINNFQNGVNILATNTNTDIHQDVTLNDLRVSNNCTAGINAVPTTGHSVRLAVTDSVISNSNVGLIVAPGAEAWVLGSSISLNNVGLGGGAPIHDQGGNMLAGNASNGAFTDSVNKTPDPVQLPAKYCKVPKVVGKTRSAATSSLTTAGCKLGKVSKKKGRKSKKGKVLAQAVPAGISVKEGTGIALTVGK
jgi:hypothetical protein